MSGLTWATVAQVAPEWVQWIVQRYGPLPDGEVRRDDYDRWLGEYEAALTGGGA